MLAIELTAKLVYNQPIRLQNIRTKA